MLDCPIYQERNITTNCVRFLLINKDQECFKCESLEKFYGEIIEIIEKVSDLDYGEFLARKSKATQTSTKDGQIKHINNLWFERQICPKCYRFGNCKSCGKEECSDLYFNDRNRFIEEIMKKSVAALCNKCPIQTGCNYTLDEISSCYILTPNHQLWNAHNEDTLKKSNIKVERRNIRSTHRVEDCLEVTEKEYGDVNKDKDMWVGWGVDPQKGDYVIIDVGGCNRFKVWLEGHLHYRSFKDERRGRKKELYFIDSTMT
jgi:hypothetical protein